MIEDDENSAEDDNDGDEEELTFNDIPLIQPVEDGQRYYSNPTIWVGVLPNTITASSAFDATKGIRAFLDGLNVTNVDIAYRETIPKSLFGPTLYAPVDVFDHLRDFIDPVSVALGVPIAGLQTTMQGTMGPYFHVDKTLYAITARHILFHVEADNDEYTFHRAFAMFTS